MGRLFDTNVNIHYPCIYIRMALVIQNVKLHNQLTMFLSMCNSNEMRVFGFALHNPFRVSYDFISR